MNDLDPIRPTLVAKRARQPAVSEILPPLRPRARPVRARKRKQPNVRLWLPITPIVIALSPFAALALPFIAAADAANKTKTAAMLVNATRVLLAASGTEVTVQARKANVHIRLF